MHVLLNPIAGGHRAPASWRQVERAARAAWPGLEVLLTEGPGHATVLAREAVAAGAGRVVVVGGDGTIQETVAGLLHTGVPLAVIPAGTGNDFSRTHLIPRNLAQAMAVAAGGHTRKVDVGLVNGRPYVNIAGVGFDAEVAAWTKYRTRWLRGPWLYVAGVLSQLLLFRPQRMTVTLDGVPQTQKCLLVAVGNGRYYGGGMMVCPSAEPDDGMLEVVVGGDLSKRETLVLLTKVFSGQHVGRPKVSRAAAQTVTIEGPAHLAVHADGEPVGTLPAEFSVLRSAIEVAVPAGVGSSKAH